MHFLGVRNLAGAALAGLLMLAGASAQAAEFIVRGTAQDGSSYNGRVVTDIVGDTVKVVWNIAGQRYVGNGVIYQDAVAIYYTGNLTGVALYKRDPSTGAFRGRWTTGNSNSVGNEEWIPVGR